MTALTAPLGMLAELTHRCPLACPYCSNPLALEDRAGELDTATWARVFDEAAQLGVLQVHLSGGEPLARRDIREIVVAAHEAGLYTNLITSAVGLDAAKVEALREAGLDHVQISFQDVIPETADWIGGYKGGHARKLAAARAVVEAGLAFTVNAVLHRTNVDRLEGLVRLAVELGAGRVEVAHVQYYGWGLKNRDALVPTRAQVEAALETVDRLRDELAGRIVIDAVVPDYYARRPKPCMGGWGRRSLNVTPHGKVLPCHAAETIPGLEFSNVRQHALRDIWVNSPAFNAFRGTDWMQEPCRSCEFRERDFGGCRCQALALAGDARATDPVCEFSPLHRHIAELAEEGAERAEISFAYRGRRVRDGAVMEDVPA